MSKGRKILRILGILLLLLLIVGGIGGYMLYQNLYAPNTYATTEPHELFIPSNSSYETVKTQLIDRKIIKDATTFERVAQQMNYPNHIYGGKYLIKGDQCNRDLLRQLRSGKTTPVKVTINPHRDKYKLAGIASLGLQADSLSVLQVLEDDSLLKDYGFNSENVLSMIIPDTYQFDWNTDAKGFMKRMKKEYDRFWTEERKAKAKKQGLTPYESLIIASIVEEETNMVDEMPLVAGVYLNRYRKGWKLQADPTVKFAMGDFALRRILFKHLEFDSPYNTYMYEGLPPGPICVPSKDAINGVLNAPEHQYMYFCAKEDFSGYHNFAKTLRQHNINAANYQKELSRRNIR